MSATIAPDPLAVDGITTDAAAITASRHSRSPDRLWICDLSQVWGGTTWLYFAYVLDCESGRCLGWSPHRVPHGEVISDALRRATTGRRFGAGPRRFEPAEGKVPVVFGRGCRNAEIEIPRWAVPSAADAALCEAFIAGLRRLVDEHELQEDRAWSSFPEAERAIVDWIDERYNPPRECRAGSDRLEEAASAGV